MEIKIGLNEETLAALNALTAAIAGIGGRAAPEVKVTANVAKPAETTKNDAEKPAAEDGPVYWADSKDGQFGKVNKEAEYTKLKKKSDTVYKITKDIYDQKAAELREKNEAAKNAKAAEPKAADKGADEFPTLDDLVAAFSKYLPKDLDVEERQARYTFAKPLLARFGAKVAREIPEEHRALAINLVERKMAGEEVDPKTAEFAEVGAAAEEELV